jgi:hypothetical protein
VASKAPKVIRHGPQGAAVMKSVTAPQRARPAAGRGRTLTAAVVAIALPAMIGLGLGYWSLSTRPAITPTSEPEADGTSAALRGGSEGSKPTAYEVTAPVAVAHPAAAAAQDQPVAALDRPSKKPRGLHLRQPAVHSPAEEPAPDDPTYGILDPAPAN